MAPSISSTRRCASFPCQQAVSLRIVNDSRRCEDKVRPKSNQTSAWPEYSTPLHVTVSRPVHDYAICAKPFRFANKIPESFALVLSWAAERKPRNLLVFFRRRLVDVINIHGLFRCTLAFIKPSSLCRRAAGRKPGDKENRNENFIPGLHWLSSRASLRVERRREKTINGAKVKFALMRCPAGRVPGTLCSTPVGCGDGAARRPHLGLVAPTASYPRSRPRTAGSRNPETTSSLPTVMRNSIKLIPWRESLLHDFLSINLLVRCEKLSTHGATHGFDAIPPKSAVSRGPGRPGSNAE